MTKAELILKLLLNDAITKDEANILNDSEGKPYDIKPIYVPQPNIQPIPSMPLNPFWYYDPNQVTCTTTSSINTSDESIS